MSGCQFCVRFTASLKRVLRRSEWFAMSISDESQPPNKKMNIENGDGKTQQPKIGTHNGSFHCDEVLACFMLKQLPKYKNARIVRSRDPAVLDECDIVVDVGGIFDPAKNRFDHHQRTFDETMNSLNSKMKWTTKLSSAGLVYFHFGREVLSHIILPQTIDDDTMDVIYNKMYDNFVEEIDAVDNGVDQYDGEPRYRVTSTIGARVGRTNPSWNEKNCDEQALFMKAMEMVGTEFKQRILGFINSWLPARSLVEDAIKQRFEVHKSGEIIELKHFCPWKDHLFTLEEEQTIEPAIKYVIYADAAGKARVQCVPAGKNTFENRLSLLSQWKGLRDEELSKTCGIPDCIFVHASGFIGGNKTKEGALAMAVKSLQAQGCG
uniref:MYG1 exonuclease-like n=1 Tax=Styela clava TaxID=7725 RepID=UPI00193A1A4B|nr:MYG1 exonuclease-like [Styela clava]